MINAADEAAEAFGAAACLTDSNGVGMALRKRIDNAAGGPEVLAIDQLLDDLAMARLIVGHALGRIPKKQKRDRAATWHIRRIHDITGIKPSKQPRSKFRRIVETLYTEAGFPYQSAEAAISNYIKEGSG